jgi:hypothetical protein
MNINAWKKIAQQCEGAYVTNKSRGRSIDVLCNITLLKRKKTAKGTPYKILRKVQFLRRIKFTKVIGSGGVVQWN